ncbi:MAG: aldo/keto reductase family oxidoreductase [Kordiimonas sp.]
MSDYLSIPTRYNVQATDLEIGSLAYGCWRFAGSSVEQASTKINTALGSGLNLIDTADIYTDNWPEGFGNSEKLLGDVFKATPALRHQIILATKGGIIPGLPYNSSASYLIEACEASLKRLNTDVIDIYQIHRPDLTTSLAETAEALTKLKDAGKIRYAGVSNYTYSQYQALQTHLPFSLISHQPEFSCIETSPLTDGILDQCQEHDLLAIAWSPLAGGALVAGQIDNHRHQTKLNRLLPVLDRLAENNATTRTAVALAFILAHPAKTIPIIGTQTPERIKESTQAFDVKLTRRDWYDILEASIGEQMP